jgi:hypothetical protein
MLFDIIAVSLLIDVFGLGKQLIVLLSNLMLRQKGSEE